MKPIVIQVTRDGPEWPKGSELGYATEADAKNAHGDNYKIMRHTDSSEYVAPKRDKPDSPVDPKAS